EMARPGPGLGDQQATRRVAVEAMDKARRLALLVRQALQHAVHVTLGAAAALHRQSVRLVEHVDLVILVEDKAAQKIGILLVDARAARFWGGLVFDGRDPHHLSRAQPRIGLRPRLVDAYLAGTDELLQPPERQLRVMQGKPPVEAHAVFGIFHRKQRHRTHIERVLITQSPAKSAEIATTTESSA